MAEAKYERKFLLAVVDEMNTVMMAPESPVTITDDMSDDDVLTRIKHEATGFGNVDQAIRFRDFYETAEDKKGEPKFSAAALKFFTETGVWDASAGKPIMPGEGGGEELEQGQASAGEAAAETGASAAAETAQAQAAEPVAVPGKAKGKKAGAGKAAKAAPAKAEEKTATEPAQAAAPAEKKKEEVMKGKTAVKKKDAKTAPAKSGKSRGTATQKKAASKKEAAPKDAYGFREDSMSAKALALFETGKYTMAEAVKKLGSTTDFNYALRKVKDDKHFKVEIDDAGKIKVTSK